MADRDLLRDLDETLQPPVSTDAGLLRQLEAPLSSHVRDKHLEEITPESAEDPNQLDKVVSTLVDKNTGDAPLPDKLRELNRAKFLLSASGVETLNQVLDAELSPDPEVDAARQGIDVIGALATSIDRAQLLGGHFLHYSADVINSETIANWSQRFIQRQERDIEDDDYVSNYNKGGVDTFNEDGLFEFMGWTTEKILENTATAGATIGTAILSPAVFGTGAVGLATTTAITGITGTILGIGEVRQELEEKGIDSSENLALVGGLGLMVGLIDTVGAGATKIGRKLVPKVGSEFLEKILINPVKAITVDNIKPAAAQALKRIGFAIPREGGSESFEEAVVIGGGLYAEDPDISKTFEALKTSENLNRMIDSGIVGSAMGTAVATKGVYKSQKNEGSRGQVKETAEFLNEDGAGLEPATPDSRTVPQSLAEMESSAGAEVEGDSTKIPNPKPDDGSPSPPAVDERPPETSPFREIRERFDIEAGGENTLASVSDTIDVIDKTNKKEILDAINDDINIVEDIEETKQENVLKVRKRLKGQYKEKRYLAARMDNDIGVTSEIPNTPELNIKNVSDNPSSEPVIRGPEDTEKYVVIADNVKKGTNILKEVARKSIEYNIPVMISQDFTLENQDFTSLGKLFNTATKTGNDKLNESISAVNDRVGQKLIDGKISGDMQAFLEQYKVLEYLSPQFKKRTPAIDDLMRKQMTDFLAADVKMARNKFSNDELFSMAHGALKKRLAYIEKQVVSSQNTNEEHTINTDAPVDQQQQFDDKNSNEGVNVTPDNFIPNEVDAKVIADGLYDYFVFGGEWQRTGQRKKIMKEDEQSYQDTRGARYNINEDMQKFSNVFSEEVGTEEVQTETGIEVRLKIDQKTVDIMQAAFIESDPFAMEQLEKTLPETAKQLQLMRSRVDGMSNEMIKTIETIVATRVDTLSRQAHDAMVNRGDTDRTYENEDPELLSTIRTSILNTNEGIKSLVNRIDTIESNKGEYLNKAYHAYSSPRYRKTMQKGKEKYNAFVEEYSQHLIDTNQVVSKEKAVNAAIIEADTLLKSIRDRGSESDIDDARKNLTPAHVRFLGPKEDILQVYSQTMDKMADKNASRQLRLALFDVGIQTGFVEIIPKVRGDKVRYKSNNQFDPFNGTIVDNAFLEAYESYKAGNMDNEVMQVVNRVHMMVKAGNTLLNPISYSTNFLGSGTDSIAMGAKILWGKDLETEINYTVDNYFDGDKAKYDKFMFVNDVVGSNVTVRMLRQMTKNQNKAGDNILDKNSSDRSNLAILIDNTMGKVITKAGTWYEKGDSFHKENGFVQRIRDYERYKPDWTKEQVLEAAIQDVKDNYQQYRMVPRVAKDLFTFRRRGGKFVKLSALSPLANSFLAFRVDALRKILTRGMNTIAKFKDPDLRPIAFKQLLGTAAIYGLNATGGVSPIGGLTAVGLTGLSRLFGGEDDVDKESRSRWSRNSPGFGVDGYFVDTGQMFPQSVIVEPMIASINAYHRKVGTNNEKYAAAVGGFLQSVTMDMMGGAITTNMFVEAKEKTDRILGKPTEDNIAEWSTRFAANLGKEAARNTVGLVRYVDDLYRDAYGMYDGIVTSGQPKPPYMDIVKLFGVRIYKASSYGATRSSAYNVNNVKRTNSRKFSAMVTQMERYNPGRIRKDIRDMKRDHIQSYSELITKYNTLVINNDALSPDEFIQAVNGQRTPEMEKIYGKHTKNTLVSKKDLAFIIEGKIPPMRLSIPGKIANKFAERAIQGRYDIDKNIDLRFELEERTLELSKLLEEEGVIGTGDFPIKGAIPLEVLIEVSEAAKKDDLELEGILQLR